MFIERYNEEEIKAYEKEQNKVVKSLDKSLKLEEKRFTKEMKAELRRASKEKRKNNSDIDFAKKMSNYSKIKHKKMKNAYYTKGSTHWLQTYNIGVTLGAAIYYLVFAILFTLSYQYEYHTVSLSLAIWNGWCCVNLLLATPFISEVNNTY